MRIDPARVRAVYECAERLYSAGQVEKALDRMAAEISPVLKDADPLLLCVMTGGLVPAGHLLTRLDFPLQVDYVHPTRYRGETRGGLLEWRVPPEIDVRDRTVLIVDDILDEGHTLVAVSTWCTQSGARAVYSAVLVDKQHTRKNGPSADFTGVQVDDRYVFGYGMDYRGYLRNAPGIFAVDEQQESNDQALTAL